MTGSGCRWAPGLSPGWRKHQSTGTAVPSYHYFSPDKNKRFPPAVIDHCHLLATVHHLKCNGKTYRQCESESYSINIHSILSHLTGLVNCSDSLWGVPGYGPDRRRRTSWSLYLDLFFSILITNAYHSIHHTQGQVLTVICPPMTDICIKKNGDRGPYNSKWRLHLPTACYFAVHFMLVNRLLLWGPKS